MKKPFFLNFKPKLTLVISLAVLLLIGGFALYYYRFSADAKVVPVKNAYAVAVDKHGNAWVSSGYVFEDDANTNKNYQKSGEYTVTKINKNGKVVGKFRVDAEPYGVTIGLDGSTVYVSGLRKVNGSNPDGQGAITVLDNNGKHIDTYSPDSLFASCALVFDPKNGDIYSVGLDNHVNVFDKNGKRKRTIEGVKAAADIAFDPVYRRVWVSNYVPIDGKVVVSAIDIDTGKLQNFELFDADVSRHEARYPDFHEDALTGIEVDKNGDVWVNYQNCLTNGENTQNSRILKISGGKNGSLGKLVDTKSSLVSGYDTDLAYHEGYMYYFDQKNGIAKVDLEGRFVGKIIRNYEGLMEKDLAFASDGSLWVSGAEIAARISNYKIVKIPDQPKTSSLSTSLASSALATSAMKEIQAKVALLPTPKIKPSELTIDQAKQLKGSMLSMMDATNKLYSLLLAYAQANATAKGGPELLAALDDYNQAIKNAKSLSGVIDITHSLLQLSRKAEGAGLKTSVEPLLQFVENPSDSPMITEIGRQFDSGYKQVLQNEANMALAFVLIGDNPDYRALLAENKDNLEKGVFPKSIQAKNNSSPIPSAQGSQAKTDPKNTGTIHDTGKNSIDLSNMTMKSMGDSLYRELSSWIANGADSSAPLPFSEFIFGKEKSEYVLSDIAYMAKKESGFSKADMDLYLRGLRSLSYDNTHLMPEDEYRTFLHICEYLKYRARTDEEKVLVKKANEIKTETEYTRHYNKIYGSKALDTNPLNLNLTINQIKDIQKTGRCNSSCIAALSESLSLGSYDRLQLISIYLANSDLIYKTAKSLKGKHQTYIINSFTNAIKDVLRTSGVQQIYRSSLSVNPTSGQLENFTYIKKNICKPDANKTEVPDFCIQTVGYISLNPSTGKASAQIPMKFSKGSKVVLYANPQTSDIYVEVTSDKIGKGQELAPLIKAGNIIEMESYSVNLKDGSFGGSFRSFGVVYKYNPNSKSLEIPLKISLPDALTGTITIDSNGDLTGSVTVGNDKIGTANLYFDRTGNVVLSKNLELGKSTRVVGYNEDGTQKTMTGSLASLSINSEGKISGMVSISNLLNDPKISKALNIKSKLNTPINLMFSEKGISGISFQVGSISGQPFSMNMSTDGKISFGGFVPVAGLPIPVSLGQDDSGNFRLAWPGGSAKLTNESRPIKAPALAVDSEGSYDGGLIYFRHSYKKLFYTVRVYQVPGESIEAEEQTLRSKMVFDTFNSKLQRNPTVKEFLNWYFYSGHEVYRFPDHNKFDYRMQATKEKLEKAIENNSSRSVPTYLKTSTKAEYVCLQKYGRDKCRLPGGIMSVNPFETGGILSGESGSENSLEEYLNSVAESIENEGDSSGTETNQ